MTRTRDVHDHTPRLSIAALLIVGAVVLDAQGPPRATRKFSPTSDYAPDVNKLASSTSELRDIVGRFTDDRSALLRFYTIPGSPARRERMRAFDDTWVKTLARVDFDRLSQEGKVDYVLLRTRIEYDSALVAREDRVQLEIAPLVPFSAGIVALAENRQRLDFITADAAVKALADIAATVSAASASATSAAGVSAATAVRAAQEVDTLNGALA